MSRSRSSYRGHAPFALAAVAALLLWAAPAAWAQTPSQQTQTPDAITPVEEFSRQLEQFKNSITQLNKRI